MCPSALKVKFGLDYEALNARVAQEQPASLIGHMVPNVCHAHHGEGFVIPYPGSWAKLLPNQEIAITTSLGQVCYKVNRVLRFHFLQDKREVHVIEMGSMRKAILDSSQHQQILDSLGINEEQFDYLFDQVKTCMRIPLLCYVEFKPFC